MSASTRRKKVKPVADGRITFKLVIDAQEMVVDYRPYWTSDYGQFEFRSPHDPARRIPVSETGYRSHFAPMAEVESLPTPEDYAREVALALVRAERKVRTEDADQPSLF
jgi:hypothetical protein